ncbi:MAG TPA: integration host factor subunit alpha [Legionella sp.]|nr:integration host factor subunit alpha [Legionella sp.]
MSALSKAIMVDALCNDIGLSKPDARDILDQFFEEIRSILEQGHHVKLSGFGNFVLRDKPVRPGRNPKTGEDIPVAARRVVTFKPGFKLKTKIDSRDQPN